MLTSVLYQFDKESDDTSKATLVGGLAVRLVIDNEGLKPVAKHLSTVALNAVIKSV